MAHKIPGHIRVGIVLAMLLSQPNCMDSGEKIEPLDRNPAGTKDLNAASGDIDFDEQILPLVEDSCGSCHAKGETEPDLSTEKQLILHAPESLKNIKRKHKKVKWEAEDIELFAAWVKSVEKKTKTAKAKQEDSAEEEGEDEADEAPAKPVAKPSPSPSPKAGSAKPAGTAGVTYLANIKPMLDAGCVKCHAQPVGEVKPLTDLAGAKACPEPRLLTGHNGTVWDDKQKAVIQSWIDAGKP